MTYMTAARRSARPSLTTIPLVMAFLSFITNWILSYKSIYWNIPYSSFSGMYTQFFTVFGAGMLVSAVMVLIGMKISAYKNHDPDFESEKLTFADIVLFVLNPVVAGWVMFVIAGTFK